MHEIDRLADHPRLVQVMLYIGDQAYGQPRYHPIFAAAERHGLVVGIHHSGNSPTALGFHRYYAEWHTLVPQVFMSQAVSLIFNGVFDAHPELKVNLIEGGFSCVPHLMWHADQQWTELRHEVPWVKRPPEPDHPRAVALREPADRGVHARAARDADRADGVRRADLLLVRLPALGLRLAGRRAPPPARREPEAQDPARQRSGHLLAAARASVRA